MPRVPTVEGPSVAPQASPTVYGSASGATPDAFGAGQARALQETGQVLGQAANVADQLALKAQIEDNEREAKRVDNENAIGSQEINKSYYSLRGQAAVDGYQAAQDAHKELRRKLSEGIKNPRVQGMFSQQADQRDQQENRRRDEFLIRNKQIANDDASKARVATSVSAFTNAGGNPQILATEEARFTSEIVDTGERNGEKKETVERNIVEARTVAVQGAIKSALAAEDVLTAQRLLDTYGAKIDGAVRAELHKAVRDGAVTTQAQVLRDQALKLFPNDPVAGTKWIMDAAEGKVENEAVQQAQQVYGVQASARAQERADVNFEQSQADRVRRITTEAREDANAEWSRKERERTEQIRAAVTQAEDHIEKGNPFRTLPAEVRSIIDGTKEAALRKREQQIAGGEPLNTNWDKFNTYTRMGADELRNIDLSVARTELADAEFTQVKALVLSANQGRYDDKNSPTAVFNARADQLGLIGPDYKEQRGRLNSMFIQEVAKEQATIAPKQITDAKIREILTSLTDPIEIQGKNFFGFFSGQGALYEVEVPKEFRDWAISQRASAKGPVPTEAEIAKAYSLNPKAHLGTK